MSIHIVIVFIITTILFILKCECVCCNLLMFDLLLF